MKNLRRDWKFPAAGALLCAMSASVFADQDLQQFLAPTNRVTVSMRLGFNIKGGFRGVGSTFAPGSPFFNSQTTPLGQPYNYSDGYVLPDQSGSSSGYTTYFGYNSVNQVHPGSSTIDFTRNTAMGLPGDSSGDNSPYAGMEVAFDHQLGKNDRGNIAYGLEFGANWLPISFGGDSTYNLSVMQTTTTYGYASGTTPPGYSSPNELPYQGSFQGPGFSLNYPGTPGGSALVGSAVLHVHQDFDSNLWGFRLGPYLDYMPWTRLDLHLATGLAAGILTANASWSETLVPIGNSPSTQVSGGGNDVSLLGGFFVGLDAAYSITDHWSVQAGVQFQDIGNYNHDFGGRSVALSLDQSLFFNFGINYDF